MASEKGSEGRQVSSCLFLKEMPLAVYQSRVEIGIFDKWLIHFRSEIKGGVKAEKERWVAVSPEEAVW